MENVKEMFTELETTHETLSKAHTETKKDLAGKIQELDETCAALEMAKTGIEERDYLIAAHEEAEDRIVSHAIEITESLTTAADDTYRLHDKLERKGAVEESNLAVVNDLKTVSIQQLSKFQDIVREDAKAQNDLLDKSGEVIAPKVMIRTG